MLAPRRWYFPCTTFSRPFSARTTLHSGHNRWSKIKHDKAKIDVRPSPQKPFLDGFLTARQASIGKRNSAISSELIKLTRGTFTHRAILHNSLTLPSFRTRSHPQYPSSPTDCFSQTSRLPKICHNFRNSTRSRHLSKWHRSRKRHHRGDAAVRRSSNYRMPNRFQGAFPTGDQDHDYESWR